MKKLVLAIALAVGLSGCATIDNLGTAYTLVTKSVANPVTRDELYRIEAGVQIVFTALNTYKKACMQGLADANCRANIAAVQVYTRQVPPYLRQLRAFVRTNDQVNAAVVYNQLVAIMGIIKDETAKRGIKTGA